jgi:glutamate/aspartate transport system substrate-binding protein
MSTNMKNLIKGLARRLKQQSRIWTLLPLIAASPQIFAATDSVTLAHIKATSTLNIGYRQLAPFSFRDETGKMTGYTISLCNLIAEELRLTLGLKTLAIHYIPTTFSDRVSALNSSKIDLDCSVNTDTPERKDSVSFSTDYYVAHMRIVALRKNNIHTLDDLRGRAVSVPRGSKDLLELNRANREKKLNLSIITSETVKEAFDLMVAHHTAAMMIDDILALPYINQSEHPEEFTLSRETVGVKMKYAIMMRKEDPQFVTFVDKTLGHITESGQNALLTSKWLTLKVKASNAGKN